jgi:hypothetical protein
VPVAAAALLQRIADFLTVGASPQASPEAAGEFSLHLAAMQAEETGKTLPPDRQDLAGSGLDLPTTALDQTGETMASAAPSPAPADALPSTASLLVPSDTLPLVTVAIAEPAPSATPEALPMQVLPNQDGDANLTQGPVQEIAQAMSRPTAPAAKQPAEQAVSPTPAADKAKPSAHLPKGKTPIEPRAKSARQAPAASSPELPAASKDLAFVAVPQSDAMVATPDVAAPQPIASIDPTPTDAAPIETAPVVVAETAQADVIPTLDARPIAGAPAEIVTPSSQPAKQAQPVRTERAKSRAPLTQHHSAHAAQAAKPAQVEMLAPAPGILAADAAPTVTAPAVVDAATMPPGADSAAPIATPAATAVTFSALVTPPTIDTITGPAQPGAMPAVRTTSSEQGSTGAPRAAVDQPAPSLSGTAAVPVQTAASDIVAATPAAVTMTRPGGVSFIARPTRVVSANTPTSAVEPSAPEAEPASASAQPSIDAGPAAERDALPFRATAKQILAAQPESNAMPRAADAETAVRTPAAEAAPTIAQHLTPAAHGSERIIATPASLPQTSLSTEQAAALVETIQMLRSEAKSDAMTLAVDHDELGRITMRFDRTDHGVAVRIDSPDPTVTQLIANSTPALRSSGEGVGMRFERQDASSSGAGTSRDAPRQGTGQDRNPTPYAQSSRPRASGRRDGLFA